MAFSNIDRSQEVESNVGIILIKSTDHCHFYEKHPDTFLQRRECWTCIFSEFGINSGNPSDTGICEFNRARKQHKHCPTRLIKELRQ